MFALIISSMCSRIGRSTPSTIRLHSIYQHHTTVIVLSSSSVKGFRSLHHRFSLLNVVHVGVSLLKSHLVLVSYKSGTLLYN